MFLLMFVCPRRRGLCAYWGCAYFCMGGEVCLLDGSLSRWVSVRGGGHSPGWSLSGEGESLSGGAWPGGHCSGRYASYWNAFLFIIRTRNYIIPTGSRAIQCSKYHAMYDKLASLFRLRAFKFFIQNFLNKNRNRSNFYMSQCFIIYVYKKNFYHNKRLSSFVFKHNIKMRQKQSRS